MGTNGVSLLGSIIERMGYLSKDRIEDVMRLQQRDASAGVVSRFGELCVRQGWADADHVQQALAEQIREAEAQAGVANMLVGLGFLSREQLDEALNSEVSMYEPLDEIVLDKGFCTPAQVRIANQLVTIQKNSVTRRSVDSNFAPFNIMELLVSEQLGRALEDDGGCTCSMCWTNVFSVALNELPPRYVSEHTRIRDFLQRFRRDYRTMIRAKIDHAIATVRANPKASCKSRFSDDLLSAATAGARLFEAVVHVSNRHIHLSPEDLEALFGKGHELQKLKDLMQPGQFAAQETVAIEGPKGSIERVRVLGPTRARTQVEISGTDQFVLGVSAPVRESGDLDGTPGIRIHGAEGVVELEQGLIRALRHIHMLPEEAAGMGVRNGSRINVRLVGDRTSICEGVLVRATSTSVLEMHIDTDEANASGIPAESMGQVIVPALAV